MIVNSYYFSVVLFVYFPSFEFAGMRLSVSCVSVGTDTSLVWSFTLVLSLRLRLCIGIV